MSNNAKRIYKDSSESFRNGNRALKGSLRSRGNVNKICRGNSERFKNRKKFPKAANEVLANVKKIHRGMLRETRQQLRNYRGQVSELQLSISTAQQTISELRSQEARDWVISRDEIQITGKCLGRGGWGIVNEGTYCGCTVAVKQIHELILSRHNINLFEREMNIASKWRHPHLLQFIGDFEISGGGLQKHIFRPFGPHFALNIRRGRASGAPSLDPPLIWAQFFLRFYKCRLYLAP